MKKIMILMLLCGTTAIATPFNLTHDQITELGNTIWQRECNKNAKKIVWWNKGEPCASLGIGHFLWFPRTKSKKFTETFPQLVTFLIEKKAPVPEWLAKNPHQPCPWHNHNHFMKNMSSIQVEDLKKLLVNTVTLQAEFILERADKALTTILHNTPAQQRVQVEQQFKRLASTTQGLFALIDYINFKGEGINPKEQYAGVGWGLKHVLLQMHGAEKDEHAIKEFTHMAKKVLEQRVAHAPNQKMEVSRLTGWKNRIDGYLTHTQ